MPHINVKMFPDGTMRRKGSCGQAAAVRTGSAGLPGGKHFPYPLRMLHRKIGTGMLGKDSGR